MRIAPNVYTFAAGGSQSQNPEWTYWGTDVYDIVFGHYCRKFQLFDAHTPSTVDEPCPHCKQLYPPLLSLAACLGITF
jgi:hypothetical protein